MKDSSHIEWRKNLDFAGIESIGARSSQEDYSLFRILKNYQGLIVVLSDGMGGHTSGEIASKNAVDAFDKIFNAYPSDSTAIKLGASLSEANACLSRLISSNPTLEGMGCTLIGAFIDKSGIHWISVGDSLLYLYRNKKLIRLNDDHSMAPLIEESLRSGKINKEVADNFPNKNALRSAVMGRDLPLIDAPAKPEKLFSSDIVIVASDGLLSLSEDKILSILNNSYKYNADEIASNLLHAVTKLNKKNQDNTTIQIIKIPDSFGREKGSSKFLYFLLFFVSSILSITAFLIFKVFIKNSDLVETKEDTKQISPITIPNSNSAPIDPAPIAQPKLAQPEPAQNSDKSNDSGVEKNAILKNSKSKNSDKKNEIKPKGIDPKRQSPLTPPVTQGQGDLSNENKSSEERVKEKQEKLPQSTPEKVDKELPDKT